jgi:hypothetical protein
MKKYFLSLIISFGLLGVVASAQAVTSQDPQSTRDFCTYVVSPVAYKSQNQYVSYLQRFLQEQYNYKVSPTGYYGVVTYGYIVRIQRALGIAGPTGSLGPITLNKLRAVWCSGNPGSTNQSGGPVVSINPVSSYGNNVVLGWNVQNATSCTLNGTSVNNVSGTQSFVIYSETTYTLNCTNLQGQTAQSSVVVRPDGNINSSLRPAVTIYTTPNTFTSGQSVMLVWSSTNATSCTVNGQTVPTSGSQQIVIGNGSAYTINCTGNGYSATQTLNVVNNGTTTTCPSGYILTNGVCQSGGNGYVPTISSFTSSNNSISSGQLVSLTWSSNNANYCTLTPSVGSSQTLASSGTIYVYPSSTTTYSLVCTNVSGNSTSSSQTISVDSINTNGLLLSIATNKLSYSIGDSLLATTTLTNNTSNVVTFNYSNGVCGDPKIDNGNAVYFSSTTPVQPLVGCGAPQVYTLAPGQSTVVNVINKVISNYTSNNTTSVGNHTLNYNLLVGNTNLIATTSFTITGSTTASQAPVISSFTGTMYSPSSVGACSIGPGIFSPCNGTGVLQWAVSSATSCSLSGGSYNQATFDQFKGTNVSPTASTTYTLTCSNAYGTSVANVVLGPNNSQTALAGQVLVNSTSFSTGNSMNISWSAPSSYSSRVQGVILDLVKNGQVVGTITRVNGSGAVSGNYIFTIPKSIRDSRNDAIQCTVINGENLCGNLVTAGTYTVVATYFTPGTSCFGFCLQVVGQQILGTVNSSPFIINSSIVDPKSNGYALTLSPTQTGYTRGSQMMVSVTVVNNTGSTQTYATGSSSCPSDVSLKVNGVDFYTFTNQQSRACTADYGTITLAPGQSYVRSFAGFIPSTVASGVYVLTATLNAAGTNISSNTSSVSIY